MFTSRTYFPLGIPGPPTTSIDANFQNNLIINTQTFTTPHSNNNSTSFVVNNYECSGNGKVVREKIHLLELQPLP